MAWTLTVSAACAQPAVTYQAYPLRHKSASEVEKQLSQVLPDVGTTTHIAADPRANQILLAGPETAQQIARQFIESIDRPPAVAAAPPVIRAYPCPPAQQDDLVARLRGTFAGRTDVRVVADPPTAQLFVLAPQAVQDVLAQQLGTAPATATSPTPPSAAPAPAATVSASPSAPPGGTPVPTPSATPYRPSTPGTSTAAAAPGVPAVDNWVALSHARAEHLEPVLARVLGPRWSRAGHGPGGRPYYVYSDQAGTRLNVEVDQQKNGMKLNGPPALAAQFRRLVESLDYPSLPSGKALRIVPVPRADPGKLQQALKAYRAGAAEGNAPAAAPGTLPDGSSQHVPSNRGPIGLVNFLQAAPAAAAPGGAEPIPSTVPGKDAAASPAAKPGAAPSHPMRPVGSDVEVEVLPDLGVIILRGRDQDVAELSRIIEELERLSAETQPSVEIYQLQHVGGDTLASIFERVQRELIGGLRGKVLVVPLVKPNALLLIGWGDAVKATRDFIAKLDTPVAPETQFRTFNLRYAPAGAARTMIQEFFTTRTGTGAAAGAGGLSGKVQISSDLRTNSLLIQAPPREMAEVAAVIESIDRIESSSVAQARLFKLKYTLAIDIAATLQAAIDAAKGSTTAATAAAAAAAGKSSVLELITVDAAGQKILKSGLLGDVRITPDPRLNTLLVSGPAESMELIAALINQLDVPVTSAQIKVFRVVNGDAVSLVQMLRALLPQGGTTATAAAVTITQDENSLAPLRFSIDPRTNSIIAVGAAGDLRIVEALLLRLDEQDVAMRKNMVYRLKNAPALDVANAINQFLSNERQINAAAQGLVSVHQQVESEVIVVPEPVSNALILSATPRYFDRLNELIEKLDAQPPQVLIQVLIAEVALSNFNEFGIEMGLQDSVLFDRSLIGGLVTTTTTRTSNVVTQTGGNTSSSVSNSSTDQNIIGATNTPGFNFNNGTPLGSSGAPSALAGGKLLGGQGLSHFNMGRVNSDLGYGGLVLSASSESVSMLLRALQECRCLEVLSRPQVMTLDNQPAFIQVGRRVPRITGTAINQVGSQNSVTLENVGLILGVTPRISPEGMVVMEIDAEKSQLGPEAEGIPVSINAQGVAIRSPIIDVTTAQTTVSANSGETILLGGLITKTSQVIDRRVPWLADIPVVGNLFRYKSNSTDRTELLIVLTPHVVRNSDDAERAKQLEASRMHWCMRDVNQIHGESGLTPLVNKPEAVIYPDFNPRGVPNGPTKAPSGKPEAVPTPQPVPRGATWPARTAPSRLPLSDQSRPGEANTATHTQPVDNASSDNVRQVQHVER